MKIRLAAAQLNPASSIEANLENIECLTAFANTIGPRRGGKHSAAASKIVAPDGKTLAPANNKTESLILATCDLTKATRKDPTDSLAHPKFLASHLAHHPPRPKATSPRIQHRPPHRTQVAQPATTLWGRCPASC